MFCCYVAYGYVLVFSFEPFFQPIYFKILGKLTPINYAELSSRGPCLQRTHVCKDNCHWITVILKETQKFDDDVCILAAERPCLLQPYPVTSLQLKCRLYFNC